MTKTAFLTGGTGGIGSMVKAILEYHNWDVVAPPRSELDLDSLRSVNDYMWHNPALALDAIVFCHGQWYSKPVDEHSETDYLIQYRQRVVHPLYLVGQYLPLAYPSCAVVMVSSTRGFIGGMDTAPYSLACAAQIAWSQGMAREYSGARFNVVCPGLTDSRMGDEVRRTGGCRPDTIAQDPVGVAEHIVALIESDANGKVIRVVSGKDSEAKWAW